MHVMRTTCSVAARRRTRDNVVRRTDYNVLLGKQARAILCGIVVRSMITLSEVKANNIKHASPTVLFVIAVIVVPRQAAGGVVTGIVTSMSPSHGVWGCQLPLVHGGGLGRHMEHVQQA